MARRMNETGAVSGRFVLQSRRCQLPKHAPTAAMPFQQPANPIPLTVGPPQRIRALAATAILQLMRLVNRNRCSRAINVLRQADRSRSLLTMTPILEPGQRRSNSGQARCSRVLFRSPRVVACRKARRNLKKFQNLARKPVTALCERNPQRHGWKRRIRACTRRRAHAAPIVRWRMRRSCRRARSPVGR